MSLIVFILSFIVARILLDKVYPKIQKAPKSFFAAGIALFSEVGASYAARYLGSETDFTVLGPTKTLLAGLGLISIGFCIFFYQSSSQKGI